MVKFKRSLSSIRLMTVAYYIHFILNRHQVQYILVYPLFFRLEDFFGSLGWKSEARLSVAGAVARIGVHCQRFFCAKWAHSQSQWLAWAWFWPHAYLCSLLKIHNVTSSLCSKQLPFVLDGVQFSMDHTIIWLLMGEYNFRTFCMDSSD